LYLAIVAPVTALAWGNAVDLGGGTHEASSVGHGRSGSVAARGVRGGQQLLVEHDGRGRRRWRHHHGADVVAKGTAGYPIASDVYTCLCK